ncbi:MAG: PTS glucose transporter subunit IIA [Synergistaceae bacterium]|jgi:PTS system beta-glucosides-specific IIC component|nr:PTS glucose transporter subunit IIA [Synergistaceae bacterium]
MFEKLKDFIGGRGVAILSPMEGRAVPLSEVSDPTFGEELVGKGIAIIPSGGRVVSPIDGTVSVFFETGHAIAITSAGGIEVLVHVGLDTVKLKGQFYRKIANVGDSVKAGDPLIEFDREGIASSGFDVITPVVIANTDDWGEVEPLAKENVRELDEIILVRK